MEWDRRCVKEKATTNKFSQLPEVASGGNVTRSHGPNVIFGAVPERNPVSVIVLNPTHPVNTKPIELSVAMITVVPVSTVPSASERSE